MVNLEIFTMFLFFIVVGLLLYKDRKHVEFHSGIVIRRWKGGLKFIDVLVKKYGRILSIAGFISIAIGMIAGIVGLGYLIFLTVKMQQAFALVLPTAGGYQYPGPIIGVPFWYWLIAIFIILFSHETMHAIFVRLAKVQIKNYGILLLFVLPIGAFVEPNMKMVQKLKTYAKLKFFAAGSFANFIVALIVLLLALLIANNLYAPSGVFVYDTVENYPANQTNLTGVIKEINAMPVKTSEDITKILGNINPGEEIEIKTTEKIYYLTTAIRPDNKSGSYIGINGVDYYDVIPSLQSFRSFILGMDRLFLWLFFLNLGIGVANMLPLKPLDGGLIYEEIFTRIFKKNGKILINILSGIVILILLFNLFGIKILS